MLNEYRDMNKVLFTISVILTCFCIPTFAQERTIPDVGLYFDEVSEVLQDCFTGWAYDNNSRNWYGNPNVIRSDKMPRAFRKAKNGGFEYSHHFNIFNLQSASFVKKVEGDDEPKRYYVLFWQKWDGFYDYPYIQEDWRCFRVYDYYIFPEDEWLKFNEIKVGENIYLKYRLFGRVENDKKHLLNDDIEYAVNHPSLYSKWYKQKEEGMCSLYIRFADDGENIRFFIDPEHSVLNSENRYFEAKYSDFAKLMIVVDNEHNGKEVISKGTTFYY